MALVHAGMNYSEAARELGVSYESVRVWCNREHVFSSTARPDFAYTATQGRLTAIWDESALPGPSPRTLSENAGNPRRGRSGGRPRLFVGFTGTDDGLPRPDLPEGAVIDAGGLQTAMERWAGRVATATATEQVGRHLKSTWDASTR